MATEKAGKDQGKKDEDELSKMFSSLDVQKAKKKKGPKRGVGPQKGPKAFSLEKEGERGRSRDSRPTTSSGSN